MREGNVSRGRGGRANSGGDDDMVDLIKHNADEQALRGKFDRKGGKQVKETLGGEMAPS